MIFMAMQDSHKALKSSKIRSFGQPFEIDALANKLEKGWRLVKK